MMGQAFLQSYDSAPRPPPLTSASCLSFSVFLCVAGPHYMTEEEGEGVVVSRIIRPQGCLALYKSSNTLWEAGAVWSSVLYSVHVA